MTTPFDALLLAGGRSSRLGQDKAFVSWRGHPLYAVQLRKLALLSPDNIYLSARPEQPFPEVLSGVTRLADDIPDLGPLGGLLAGFRASTAERVLVLAVDLPLIEEAFLSELVEYCGCHVPRSSRGWEPLAATYPRQEMLTLLEAAHSRGERRLQVILDEASAASIIAARQLSEIELARFANLNTPEDLAKLSAIPRDASVPVKRIREGEIGSTEIDHVAVEEPLEIKVNGRNIAVTMRTPGHDDELAVGFLLTEGVLQSPVEIERINLVEVENQIEVQLKNDPDFASLTRHVFTSSSCGVCGKATLDAVLQKLPPLPPLAEPVRWSVLNALPDRLRQEQATFHRTGGLHASALFTFTGDLLVAREDVGRHNALDKVIGRSFLDRRDLSQCILLVSGRISFELMQKARLAGIPVVAGISAPSSLAVAFAQESGQTLVGFLRGGTGNVYTGEIYTP
jgi:FdhD protein